MNIKDLKPGVLIVHTDNDPWILCTPKMTWEPNELMLVLKVREYKNRSLYELQCLFREKTITICITSNTLDILQKILC